MAMMVIVECASAQVTTFEATIYITTIAGNGVAGYNGDEILATDANLRSPHGVAENTLGEVIISDTFNHRVRKILLNGTITTIAGNGTQGYNGDGMLATDAQLNYPYGVTVNSLGEVLIADTSNNRIRKILLNGTITTIAGTGNGVDGYNGDGILATDANIINPYGVAVNSLGEVLITDTLNNRIRKILLNGTITTIAGIGIGGYGGDGMLATDALILNPRGVTVNSLGEVLIGDKFNHRIRKIQLDGTITTIAGNGKLGTGGDGILATDTKLAYPYEATVNALGEVLIADSLSNRIRKILLNGTITTIAGTKINGFNGDGILATDANLYQPNGIVVNSLDEVLIAVTEHHRIRKLSGVCPPNSIKSGQQCNCVTGYFGYGQYCDKYNCSNIVNDRPDVCSSNGQCVSPNNCTCNDGYFGTDCEFYNCNYILFNDTRVCSSLGLCTAPNDCTCNDGYYGTDCELYDCNNILFNDTRVCSSLGSCIAPNNCTCNDGYYGTDCEQFDCYGTPKTNSSVCSGYGQCAGINNCSCKTGYSGANCEVYSCNNTLFNDTSVCSGKGIAPNNCTCNTGYYGNHCELFDCYGTPKTNVSGVCSGSGQCIAPNNCTCKSGYYGTDCELFDCYGTPKTNSSVCSGSGKCIAPNNCTCKSGYYGTNCEQYSCYNILFNAATVCSNSGQCTAPNTCICKSGYLGQNCETYTCFGISNNSPLACSGVGSCKGLDLCECPTTSSSSLFTYNFDCSQTTNNGTKSVQSPTDDTIVIIAAVIPSVFVFLVGILIVIIVIVIVCKRKKRPQLVNQNNSSFEMNSI